MENTVRLIIPARTVVKVVTVAFLTSAVLNGAALAIRRTKFEAHCERVKKD